MTRLVEAKAILDKYHVNDWTYPAWFEKSARIINNKIMIPACAIKKVLHGYDDWTGDPSKDYTPFSKENSSMEQQKFFLEISPYLGKEVIVCECDECSGCGDW